MASAISTTPSTDLLPFSRITHVCDEAYEKALPATKEALVLVSTQNVSLGRAIASFATVSAKTQELIESTRAAVTELFSTLNTAPFNTVRTIITEHQAAFTKADGIYSADVLDQIRRMNVKFATDVERFKVKKTEFDTTCAERLAALAASQFQFETALAEGKGKQTKLLADLAAAEQALKPAAPVAAPAPAPSILASVLSYRPWGAAAPAPAAAAAAAAAAPAPVATVTTATALVPATAAV